VKFKELPYNNRFKGKNHIAFSQHELLSKDGAPRNKKIEGTNVYVLINNSASATARLLINLLDEFGHNPDKFVVYLKS